MMAARNKTKMEATIPMTTYAQTGRAPTGIGE